MRADTEKTIEELIEHYRRERKTLDELTVPLIYSIEGSDADREYRLESGVRYALDFIDVLLCRVQALERQIVEMGSK